MFGCPGLCFYCIYQYAVKMLLLNVSPTLLTALVVGRGQHWQSKSVAFRGSGAHRDQLQLFLSSSISDCFLIDWRKKLSVLFTFLVQSFS